MPYKPSIPKDWSISSFGEIFEFLPTLTLSRVDLDSDESASGIYNLHYGDIHSTYNYTILDFEIEKRIPKVINDELDESKLTFLADGDIVIADASEDYEGVGTCIELKNIGKRKVTAGLHTFAARQKKQIFSNGFKGYLFKHPWVRNELKKLATGSKVFGVSKTNVAELKIVFPPFKEQQKIAAILSKWDEAIEAQTQLIAAKETQKKALMQKLLTGEARFPGFEEEWEEKKLGEICEYKNGGSFENSLSENGNYFLISLNSLDITGKLKKNHKRLDFTDNSLQKGDLVMVLSDVAHGNFLGLTDIIPSNEFVLNQRMGALKPKIEIDRFYLKTYININQKYFKLKGQGSSQQNLSKGDIETFIIQIPTIKEQQKITSVLTSIDSEIEALKNELEALHLQKKGLMQELLTGKIRVRV